MGSDVSLWSREPSSSTRQRRWWQSPGRAAKRGASSGPHRVELNAIEPACASTAQSAQITAAMTTALAPRLLTGLDDDTAAPFALLGEAGAEVVDGLRVLAH